MLQRLVFLFCLLCLVFTMTDSVAVVAERPNPVQSPVKKSCLGCIKSTLCRLKSSLKLPGRGIRVDCIASGSPPAASLVQPAPSATKTLSRLIQVQQAEAPKFIALSMMMFWIVFVFVLTRDTKDTLIVTNCGAEAIAFLKVYGVIPAATAFMVGYTMLSNHFDTRKLFYITLIPFLVFYTFFGLVMYPARHILHSLVPADWIANSGRLSFAVKLLQHWSFALYYIVSELWGSAGVPLLFWSCANDVVPFEQAKRLYPVMSLIGNLGPILSGLTLNLASQVAKKVWPQDDERAFQLSLQMLSFVIAGAGIVIGLLHQYVHRMHDTEINTAAMANPNAKKENISKAFQKPSTPASAPTATKHKKDHLSLRESLSFLANHVYLRRIATMVLAYGVSIECTEILWKAVVHRVFPVRTQYLAFMGRYSLLVGLMSFVMMFVGSGVLHTMGWANAALLTPVMMAVVSIPFYVTIFCANRAAENSLAQTKLLLIAVYVGLVQHVLSKASKYSIFDPVKEMAYIPLDAASKSRGKAAIDVLGARLGKSAGAFLQQFVVLCTGGLMHGAPFMSLIFYAVLYLWGGKLCVCFRVSM